MAVELVTNNAMSLAEEEDLEFFAGDELVRIPDDIYSAQYIGYDKGFYRNTPKLYLRFKVLTWQLEDGPKDPVLMLPMNVPVDKNGNPLKKISPACKYYKSWVIANYKKAPKRNDRMSLTIFKNGTFSVYVKTVERKYDNGEKMGDAFKYSIIPYLTERIS